MAGEVIDEAYVEIKSKIDPGFGSDVRRAVQQAVKPVSKDVERALAPVRESVRQSIEEPFEDVADTVRTSMKQVSTSIHSSVRDVRRDFDAFNSQIDKIEANLKDLRAEAARRIAVDVDADTSEVDAKIRGLEGSLRRLKAARADIQVDIDADDATADIARVRAGLVDLGGPGGRGPIDRLRATFDGFGSSIGRFVTNSLKGVGALGSLATSAAVLKPALIAIAAVIAVPLAGALGLAAGSAFSLGGVLASLGVTFAGVKIASAGVGEAIKAQAKAQQELAATGEVSESTQQALEAAMKNLAPAARQVVRALADVQGQFGRTRKALQQSLFEGQAKNIRELSATLLPGLGAALLVVTDTVNGLADQFTKFVTAGDGARQLKAIVDGLAQTFRQLAPAFGNIGAGLLNLFEGGLNPARSLADSIVAITERFQQFTERITASGQFTEFLNRASEAAGELLGFLGNLGRVLIGVFGAGAETGVGFLGRMSDALADVSAAINTVAGQEALAGFFSNLGVAVQTVSGLLSTLAPAVAGIVTAIGPALQSLAGLINTAIGAILPALQPAIDGLTPLFATLATTLSALQPTIAALGAALAGALSTAFLGLFQAVEPLLPVLGEVLETIGGGLTQLLTALGPALSTLGEAFARVGEALGSALLAIMPAWQEAIDTLAPVLGEVASALADVVVAAADLLVAIAPLVEPLSQVVLLVAKLAGGALVVVAKTVSVLAKGLSALIKFLAPAIKFLATMLTLSIKLGVALLKLPFKAVGDFLKNTFGPAIEEVAEAFNTQLKPALDALVLAFNAEVLPVLQAAGDAFNTYVLPPLRALVDYFNSNVLPVLSAVFSAFQKALGSGLAAGVGVALAAVVINVKAVIAALKTVINAVITVGTAIANFVSNAKAQFNGLKLSAQVLVQTVSQFFASLPGRIGSGLRSVIGVVSGIFSSAFSAVRGLVSSGVNNVVEAFRSLAGKIRGVATSIFNAAKSVGSKIVDGIVAGLKATGSIATKLAQGLRDAINSVLPDRIGVDLPKILGGGNVGIDIPRLAKGGIFDRATLGIFGEAGREAIIPVTRAARAAQLVVQSGLADIPQVQRAVLDRLRLDVSQTTARSLAGLPTAKAPAGVATLSDGARSILSRPASGPVASTSTSNTGATHSNVRNITQNNTVILPPVNDPDVLADSLLARIAGDLER